MLPRLRFLRQPTGPMHGPADACFFIEVDRLLLLLTRGPSSQPSWCSRRGYGPWPLIAIPSPGIPTGHGPQAPRFVPPDSIRGTHHDPKYERTISSNEIGSGKCDPVSTADALQDANSGFLPSPNEILGSAQVGDTYSEVSSVNSSYTVQIEKGYYSTNRVEVGNIPIPRCRAQQS